MVEMALDEGEYITKVSGRVGGWVDSLKISTSAGRSRAGIFESPSGSKSAHASLKVSMSCAETRSVRTLPREEKFSRITATCPHAREGASTHDERQASQGRPAKMSGRRG